MRVLLDTHILFWAVVQPQRLSSRAASIIEQEVNEIFVSAASAWELATKVRLGKFADAEDFERNFLEYTVHRAGFHILPIQAEDALRAGRFAGDHRDPFNRLIAAQAIANDFILLSTDRQLDSFGVRRLW